MDGSAYNLWARMKKQRAADPGRLSYVISLWGTRGIAKAANQLQEAGFSEIMLSALSAFSGPTSTTM